MAAWKDCGQGTSKKERQTSETSSKESWFLCDLATFLNASKLLYYIYAKWFLVRVLTVMT